MDNQPLQFSVTRIGPDTFRLVVQSKTRILYTANIERKHIEKALMAEIEQLAVIDWRDECVTGPA